MSVKVKTILDEIARRNLQGRWDFYDKKFAFFVGEKYKIFADFDLSNPDSTSDSVRLSYLGSSDKSDLAKILRMRIAKAFSLGMVNGNFRVEVYNDSDVSKGFDVLDKAEKKYIGRVRQLVDLVYF